MTYLQTKTYPKAGLILGVLTGYQPANVAQLQLRNFPSNALYRSKGSLCIGSLVRRTCMNLYF